MVESLGSLTQSDGPFGAFMDGVTKGIMNSPEMLDILKDFAVAMRIVYDAGFKVGRMFATEFLGKGKVLGVSETSLPETTSRNVWRFSG